MGVQTQADESVEQFKEAIEAGIQAASSFLIQRPYGYDEYSEKFIEGLRAKLVVLLEWRDEVK